jgi:hypothetical protein
MATQLEGSIKKGQNAFRFRKSPLLFSTDSTLQVQLTLHHNPFCLKAVPDEDMYTVSPFPDFEDAERVEQYIRDRRVIGVRLS